MVKDAPESIMFAGDIVLRDGKDVIGFLLQTKVNLLVYSIQFNSIQFNSSVNSVANIVNSAAI